MAEPVNKRKRFSMMKNTDEDILFVNGNEHTDSHDSGSFDEPPSTDTNHITPRSDADSNSFEEEAPQFQAELVRKNGKRGRPKKANESMEWTDEASDALIQLWQSKEELYNRQHPYFYVKEAKEKAIDSIRESLEKMGFKISSSQIFSKFQSLRTYFCSQRTKIAAARKNGIYDEDYLESKWRFYKRLQFLDDNMKQRETYATRATKFNDPYGYDGLNSPGDFSRSMVVDENQNNRLNKYDFNEEKDVNRNGHSNRGLVKVEPAREFYEVPIKDEDQSFGELVTSMVRQIKPGQEKDLLKLEIQQLIIKAKYANPNNSLQE